MRQNPRLRTRAALLPALSLGLLPSLPMVLEDPATLRGLLLGLGALAVLGAGLAARWQAPFVIAAAGLTLLVTGITWESRVRNAKAATLMIRSMR